MGYRSAFRSIGAAVRQAERESIKRQHALERQRAQYEKMQELERAAYEVDVYENLIDRMVTIHKDCGEHYNWQEIIKKEPPQKPSNLKHREINAQKSLDTYSPNFFDKLFKREAKKIDKFKESINKAIADDVEEFNELDKKYTQELIDYNNIVEMAKGIILGDIKYYKLAIEEIDPLSEISEIGSRIEFEFIDSKAIKVYLHIHDNNIIPKQVKSLLKSGKLSIKEMPIGKYNEIYQDYVCSASLRVARELLNLLPIDIVLVNAKGNLLNKTNGRVEEQTILSVRFLKETIEMINFNMIDPSDSMANFIHNMGFKKTQGMSAVEELKVSV